MEGAKISTFFKPISITNSTTNVVSPAHEPAHESAHGSMAVDDEQKFIDFFASSATAPLVRGKPMQGRRKAVFGLNHGRKVVPPQPFSLLPPEFKRWCVVQKRTGFNSLTVDVCEAGTQFQWSIESTEDLARREVVFLSFALNASDRKSNLANVSFRWPSRKDPAKRRSGGAILKHGTALRFSTSQHKQLNCENRQVAKLPWLRLTLRVVKT